jgi:uncharacterized membrane protein
MSWNLWYRVRGYIRASLWIVPFLAIPLALILTRVLDVLDSWLGWDFLGISPSGAQDLLKIVIDAALTFSVFVFSSLMVAVQVASGQLTPRIIAPALLQDQIVRRVAGLFIFTLLFSVSALNRTSNEVNQLIVFAAASFGVLCFAAFLYLIDYAVRLLRPVSILARVSDRGIAVIENVYPEIVADRASPRARQPALGDPSSMIRHEGASGIVLAVNVPMLIDFAERSDCVIEVVPQVGDFVAKGDPLFGLYGTAALPDVSALPQAVIFGSERTMEQDPTFAFRIVIDIALRALSPAINDPTTAVLAIDQLHRLLRRVGQRNLRTEHILGHSGLLRVILRTPNWEDFVHLAFSEIRHCGSGNLQVARRLRAMIENLVQTLPPHRHEALKQQLQLLDGDIEARFSHPEDQVLAHVPDTQGLGGRSGYERA